MCPSSELEIRLCRCNLKRTTSQMKMMRYSLIRGVRYCRVMANPLVAAWVPGAQA